MSKVSFTTLKLKKNDSTETIKVGEKEIEIKKYLPASDKYDLIMISLQESYENGVYNPVKIGLYFNLNIVYLYTNISFTDKQKQDPWALYDILENNGIITRVIATIEEDYKELLQLLEETKESYEKYNFSGVAIVDNIINSLPENAKTAANILDTFDPEKYSDVMNFAKGIGMKV